MSKAEPRSIESIEPMILMSATTVIGGSADDLLTGTDFDGDYLRGKEGDDQLFGLAGGDQLRGDEGADLLDGGAGDDLLRGGDGDDTLIGGEGNDDLRGDAGTNTVRYATQASTDFTVTDRGDGRYLLNDGTFEDKLRDVQFAEFTDGVFSLADLAAGNNGGGNNGGGGNPDAIVGTEQAEYLAGGSSDDEIQGLGGDDHLNGKDGSDLLLGGEGDDLVRGRAGDDTLDGGAGNDDLRGDEGSDTARYTGINSTDVTLTDRGDGRYYVDVNGERDKLRDIEFLQFDDGVFSIEELTSGGGNNEVPGEISLTVDAVTVDENSGQLNVILFRGNGADGEVSVEVTTSSGSATASEDFQSFSQVVTFADGMTGQQIAIDLIDDNVSEAPESFSISLSNPTNGATLGNITTQVVTINDNDAVTGIVYEETFEGTAVGAWTTDPLGTDTATTGQWEIGSPQETTYNGDTFQPNAGHSGTRALVTGLAAGSSVGSFDVDGGVTIVRSQEIVLPDVDEIELSFVYSLAYTANSSADDFFHLAIVSNGVDYEIYDDHAHSEQTGHEWQDVVLDISQFSGQTIQLQFEAGDLSNGSIVEAAVDDIRIEALPPGPGEFNVETTAVNVEEGSGTATITVSRTNGRSGSVSVDYSTVAGSASTADFTPISGTLTFEDGESEQSITVQLTNDDIEESLESFEVQLSDPTNGASIGSEDSATVTIVDDDNVTGDYLPDLVPIAATLGEALTIDTTEQAGRSLLRFSTEVANLGDGPLEIWGGDASNGSQDVFQRIYQEDGGSRDVLAGEFVYHPGHGHIHFEGFATYNLKLVDGSGNIIASGGKTSFCLINIRQPDPQATAEAGRVHGRGGNSCGNIQGISVGYSDVYSASLDDQWIDITNVADGTYWLEIEADPDNNIVETDESNNTARIQVTIQNGQVST